MGNTSAPASDRQGMTTTERVPTDEQFYDLHARVRDGLLTEQQLARLNRLLMVIATRAQHVTATEGIKAAYWADVARRYAELLATLD